MTQAIQLIKETLGLLWVTILVVLLLLLIIAPESTGSFVHDRLKKARIHKVSVGGVELEMERGLEKATDQLVQAQQLIASLTAEKERLSQTLTEAQKKVGDAQLQSRIREAQQQLDESSIATERLQASLESTVVESRQLLKQNPGQPLLSGVAYCYQEDRHKDGADRFSVHCHADKDICERARGPSKVRLQTKCESTDLSKAKWTPAAPGWLGSTYQFSRTQFPSPFPQLSGY